MTYRFTVSACDAAGNCSAESAAVLATTGVMSLAFVGNLNDHNITKTSTGYTVRSNASGTVIIPANVKRLEFADKVVGLDFDGIAGQVYRLYRGAFSRKPDLEGLGVHLDAMETYGTALEQIAQNFIDSPEFSARYGALNTTQFVTQLYANVLGRIPDPGGLSFHSLNIDSGRQTRAQVLIGFSESPENQAKVIGEIQNGIPYVPREPVTTASDPKLFISPFGR